MVDHISPERRSWLMSQVRGKHTKPELAVRRAAHALGLRFRLHRPDLPGRPDLTFKRHRVALFVHGCFWHRHEGCRLASTPRSRTEFWREKFDRNVERDKGTRANLQELGWRVETIWECETRDAARLSHQIGDIFDPNQN